MSKTQQTGGRTVETGAMPYNRIPTDAEVRDALRRGRQMQARAIMSLFSRLGR